MSKIKWYSKAIYPLIALALVFSLAAIALAFGGSSVASAQGDGMVCQTSSINYTGENTSTTHNFTVPMGATALAYVVVEFRGDFGDWSPSWNWTEDEFIEVYIEGDYIGRDHSDNLTDCNVNWTAATWPLSAAQMSGWAADGTISVTVANSAEVDDCGGYDQHRVTLCYTTAAPSTCEQSLISYTGDGASTTHNFTVPVGATALAYVVVEFRGDFGDWSPSWNWTEDEFIEVYIEGDYIGRDHSDNLTDCNVNWTAATWPLTAAQMSDWAADGMISVTVANSAEVDDCGGYDQHRVILCYTTAAPSTCAQSLISYTGDGASTTHNFTFTVPVGATAGYVVVGFRGDFGDWSPSWNWTEDEFIEVYIEGDYIGRDQGDWDDCSENWTAATWPLSAAQMSDWAADGMISVTVANSQEVQDFCPDREGTYNQHRVTLCYTVLAPPPVGGEAYPVNKASILASWIGLAVLLAGGIGWFVFGRRRAQS